MKNMSPKIILPKKEIKHWVERWKKLPQGPIRNMVIKIWSKSLNKFGSLKK